jgi:ABC-2 type transport system ATP-binding protein
MLRLKNFSKRYHDRLVLEIKALDFKPGVHWIKGENGSGKSTLFKSIAGIIPFDGEVILNNVNLKKDPVDFRRYVNYSEAEPIYPGFLTAKDLIRFVGKAKGSSLAQQQYYCTQFGLNSYFETTCETYSSGMLKKVSLVLAFLGSPKVIILDEPLITLDTEARLVLANVITELLTKEIIFLISSHQMIESESLPIQSSFSIQNKSLIIEGNH